MQKVSDEEVIKLYDGTHVALESMNTFYGLVRSYKQMDNCAILMHLFTVNADVL